MPKVSVVIPTYNRAAFLQGAIQSVLNQTFQDFEVIVVDDASQDQTRDLIRAFTDPRIRYIRHQTNKGQGFSRNDGISHAEGEYVAFLDDDDEWLPHKLEKQVRLLDGSPSKVGMVYSGFYRIDGFSKQLIDTVNPGKRGDVYEQICQQNWIGTCSTVLLRKVCLDEIGRFDEGLASAADYDMWIRLSKEFEIDCVCEPLVLYTVHSNRISTNHESLTRGIEALVSKHASIFATDSKRYSQRYLFLGVQYCCKGDLGNGRAAFFKALKLYPFDIRHYYYLCLSLLGADAYRKGTEVKETTMSCIRNLISLVSPRKNRELPHGLDLTNSDKKGLH